ncbi:MAG: tRNA (adenosine(37)-N6)-dimethylallyltransferase MiaA [Gemmatimonadetes bacterium]|nr:tRNA (adenosine(37)-N6)-dimethylallyltransferase MiaA [Gemmatimonadota bacterium]
MSERPPQFLALAGPTATGKTDLSLAVSAAVDVEVISMDSRQVYRGMDIGTDKVSRSARARVPHHGLDLISPDERYSAGRFARDARAWIDEIRTRGRLPLLVGGTGFFLRAVVDPVFAEPPLDPQRVDALRTYLRGQSRERLSRWVEHLDPERAPLAREGGPQRLARTLEVALLSGRPLSWWHRAAPTEASGLPGVIVVLDLPREEMHRRIDERVGGMVERGLVEEVRGLLAAGYREDAPGMTGTGYREIAAYLRGEVSLEGAVEEIRSNTRKYARRQLTWYRHQMPDSAVRVDATAPLHEQVDVALAAFERAGGTLPWKDGVQHEVGT